MPDDLSVNTLPTADGFEEFPRGLKERIRTAQVKAALTMNRELVLFYWQVGRDLTVSQETRGWGEAVIRRLAADLTTAFPGVEGFSYRNLYRMRAFRLAYPDEAQFVTQAVSQIPWGHNIVLFQKLKDTAERLWYAQSGLYGRQGKAVTNSHQTLPALQSDLAHQLVKDPYNFDFLTLGRDA